MRSWRRRAAAASSTCWGKRSARSATSSALLSLSQPAVSKHLKVLRDAGLVESRTDAQRRIYRVRPEPLREVDEWLAPYRRQWADHLNALERHLEIMDGSDGRP